VGRHLSAGARAIIAAQAARLNGQSTREAARVYQENDGSTAPNLGQLKGTANRIDEANQVLDWAPDLVPNVVAGG
jgi:hypothetical protein